MVRWTLRKGVQRLLDSQQGFTLVETLVALGITLSIGAVLVGTLHQMSNFTSRSSAQVAVIADVGTAFQWLSYDMKMANTTDLVDMASPVSSLILNWTDKYDGASITHSAAYSKVGTELRRTEDGVNTHTVARNVTSVDFSLVGNLATVTLISTDDKWVDVTKQFSHYFYLYSVP